MKIVKCLDCEQIFFIEDGGEESRRSFEKFVCEDCQTERVWRLQHFEGEEKES